MRSGPTQSASAEIRVCVDRSSPDPIEVLDELMRLMKIQAVLFDLDGTLLNSLEDIAVAMNRVLELRDTPGIPSMLIASLWAMVWHG